MAVDLNNIQNLSTGCCLNEKEHKHSSTYVHYGSNKCPEDKLTSLVYDGYVASSPRNHLGSGTNLLCLPRNPVDISNEPALTKNGSLLAGVKYGELLTRPFKFNNNKVVLNGAVCAVCLTHVQTVYTFYGQHECPELGGWNMQYAGYAMASENAVSENICVDTKLEAHQDSYIGPHDLSLKFSLANYLEKTVFVPCVVCSK
ncbi:uncharacterized protein CDAR_430871 [Caerostris darwini]|uniref:Uncharacterized protein n=1 Tax=Caerostris darwini TaxID=1538125 RepID=A0AAV4RHQ5_9ARAC|nr:uncharacterized protein CDAR_430871 [Caerostris darwini]